MGVEFLTSFSIENDKSKCISSLLWILNSENEHTFHTDLSACCQVLIWSSEVACSEARKPCRTGYHGDLKSESVSDSGKPELIPKITDWLTHHASLYILPDIHNCGENSTESQYTIARTKPNDRDAMMDGVTYLHYPLAYTTAVIFPPASQNMRMMCIYIYIYR